MAEIMAVNGLRIRYSRIKGELDVLHDNAKKNASLLALRRSQLERLEQEQQAIIETIAAKAGELRTIETAALLAFDSDLSATPSRRTVPHHGARHGALTAAVLRILAGSTAPLSTQDLALAAAPALSLPSHADLRKVEEQIRYALNPQRLAQLPDMAAALRAAILLVTPEVDLDSVIPITYQSKPPVPRQALVRSTLTVLRQGGTAMQLGEITALAASLQGIDLAGPLGARFAAQLERALHALRSKQVVQRTASGWSIQAA